jgi:hypothetical protein
LLDGSLNIQTSGQKPPAIGLGTPQAWRRAFQQRRANGVRVRRLAAPDLLAQEKASEPGHERRREARAAVARGAARDGAEHVHAGRQDALVAIGLAPIARGQRIAVPVHRTDDENGRGGRRDMQAFASIIACRSHDQDVALEAAFYRLREDRLGFARGRQLPATDVDDLRVVLGGKKDGTRQVELRASQAPARRFVGEDWDRYAPAIGGNALNGASRLPKDDARDVGPVRGSSAVEQRWVHQCMQLIELRTAKARVGNIDRAVENCDADPIVTPAQLLRHGNGGIFPHREKIHNLTSYSCI